jgi:hypothetical protein
MNGQNVKAVLMVLVRMAGAEQKNTRRQNIWNPGLLQMRCLNMFALMFETQEEVNEAIERLSADKPFIVNMQYVSDDFRQYC